MSTLTHLYKPDTNKQNAQLHVLVFTQMYSHLMHVHTHTHILKYVHTHTYTTKHRDTHTTTHKLVCADTHPYIGRHPETHIQIHTHMVVGHTLIHTQTNAKTTLCRRLSARHAATPCNASAL